MDKFQAAKEIVMSYERLGQDTASIYAVWYGIEMYDMTIEELAEGLKHLARTDENVVLTPAMYPGLFSTRELETTVRFGGRDCNTLYIKK